MVTRTQRVYQKPGLFEELQVEAAVFDTQARGALGGAMGALSALILTCLLALFGYVAQDAGHQPLSLALYVASALFGLSTLSKVLQGLQNTWERLFHRPSPVTLFVDGLQQKDEDGQAVAFRWEDIRVIQHRRQFHLIRGKDKSPQIEISTRLLHHKDLAAFVEFAFLLRQEIGEGWDGLYNEVRARLGGSGFHFHFDRNREHGVHITAKGLGHSFPDGSEQYMDWDLLKESIFERTREGLVFRHTGSKSMLTIPTGSRHDVIIDQFIRWALHSTPTFG